MEPEIETERGAKREKQTPTLVISGLFEGIETGHHEVDDDCEIEGDASPQCHVTAEPEQQRVGWNTSGA